MKTAAAETRSYPSGEFTGSLSSWLLWILLLLLTGTAALFSTNMWGKIPFFFFLLMPILSFLLVLPVRKQLSASFSFPVNASKGQAVPGTITLKNGGLSSCRKAVVRFRIRNTLTGESSERSVELSAPAKGSASASFMISSEHCGMLQFSVKDVRLCDWFGLFRVRASLSESKGILILPSTFPAHVDVSLPYSELGDEENQSLLRGMEDPSEVYAFREYQPGDPIRQIHWKLSAKREMPILKEISRPVSRTLLLFWKKTSDTPADAADALAEAFASTAMSLASRQISFTIGWQDKNGVHTESVLDEASLFGAISMAVRHGARKGSTPEYPDTQDYAKVLWFSNTYPFEEEPLLSSESAVFLCNTEMPASGKRYTVYFRPDEAEQIFKAIQV